MTGPGQFRPFDRTGLDRRQRGNRNRYPSAWRNAMVAHKIKKRTLTSAVFPIARFTADSRFIDYSAEWPATLILRKLLL
jgi:hypothetical protein